MLESIYRQRKLISLVLLTSLLFFFFNLTLGAQQVEASTNEDILKGIGAALLLIMLVKWANQNESTAAEEAYHYNQQDLQLLAQLINGEARGEPFIGQVAVGAVVINRIKSPQFPNTMREVIFQKGQFTCVSDGQFYLRPSKTAYEAAKRALAGEDPSRGALFFYNPRTAKTLWWLERRPITVIIGNHVFAR